MAKGKPPPFQKKSSVPPPRGIGSGRPNPFGKAKAPPFGKGKAPPFGKFADGGEVGGKGEKPESLVDKAKKALGIGGKPTITGGMADAIKKRQAREAAIERGEPDPGQENVKLARGGRVRR